MSMEYKEEEADASVGRRKVFDVVQINRSGFAD